MTQIARLLPLALVAACASPSLQDAFPQLSGKPGADTAEAGVEATSAAMPVTPEERPETLDPTPPPPPPPQARTVEQFDTTSAEDRAEALAPPSRDEVEKVAQDGPIGTTLATLGSPTDPGIWVKTPLVSELAKGRVDYKGRFINVELRPSGGLSGSGSQISLAAMRLLDAPLTEIVELTVYQN